MRAPSGRSSISDADGFERARHDGDAIGLLLAQLVRAADDRLALRGSCRDEQDRKLVDRERHELRRHDDAAQLALQDPDIGDGLGADDALVAQLDPGAHLAQDRQQAGARRVDADVLDQSSRRAPRGSRPPMKNAAELKSAGTRTSPPRSVAGPANVTVCPAPSDARPSRTPMLSSMRSV